MARKSYTAEEREKIRETLLTAMLQCIIDKGLIHSSIDVLSKKAGISRAYFYTFFSSKEELVLEAIRYQQPKLLRQAREQMADPSLSWREAVEKFLRSCCYGSRNGVAVLSAEEEQEVFRYLKPESHCIFRQAQLKFFSEMLRIFGIPEGGADPKLFGNMALVMLMVYKGMPGSLPFLFYEAADVMAEFQIKALADWLEQARKSAAGS